MERPIAAILTLGCKLNLAESDEIARGLVARGYTVVEGLCDASTVVINTCSVTHTADQKARKLIRTARRVAPGATVAVTGCFPQTAGMASVEALGADVVAGNTVQARDELLERLAPKPAAFDRPRSLSPLRTRAFIRAQSGCNDLCAFCIVPRTRGRETSRPAEEVADAVNAAAVAGAREVVITGTQLGAWGRDLDPPLRPHHLIAALLERCEVPRIRFSSLQPQDITPELLALWRDPRLMPHFHLALQSGSESILASMRRRYSAREFLDAAERIRAAVPGVAITTDVITGFPGETEADFEDTLSLCREAGFARIHAFPYSKRARTAAANMSGQVDRTTVKARMARLVDLGTALEERFHAAHAGEIRPVLWESARGGTSSGYTDNYIPVSLEGAVLVNRITPARIGLLVGGRAASTLVEELP